MLSNPNVNNFAEVLDGANDYKFLEIAGALRNYNLALLQDRTWLIVRLSEYGINLSRDLPIPVLQQFLLNAETITSLRGSKIGLQLWVSVLTLGQVTINDTDMYKDPLFLLLDSVLQGYMMSDSNQTAYAMVSDSIQLILDTTLGVTVQSKYYGTSDWTNIEQFLRDNIESQVAFPGNLTVNYSFSTRAQYYFHPLLNTDFL